MALVPNRFTRVPDAPNGPDAGMAVWAYLEILGGIMLTICTLTADAPIGAEVRSVGQTAIVESVSEKAVIIRHASGQSEKVILR